MSFWFVFHKITTNANLEQFFVEIQKMPPVSIWGHLLLVFALMFVNWFIEAQKWRYLTQKIEPMHFWRSVQGVFSGLCWAVFTPNRIGEYGGRIFFLKPRKRAFGLMAMAVGNVAQMILTNVFGALAMAIFLLKFQQLPTVFNLLIVVIAVFFSAMLLFMYFNISGIESILLRIKFLRKFERFFKVLRNYHFRQLFNVLGFAALRYTVFTTQYFIFFHWLMPEMQIADILLMTIILLFVQSALPSLDIFDIGVRSITALYFFNYVTTDDISVIAGTAGIWLINIIIPAVIGSVFVFKINIFDKEHSTSS